tara:strand:- start:1530 stop:1736 length:207 start_codon:yes stop_codon:yes gene_type:complete
MKKLDGVWINNIGSFADKEKEFRIDFTEDFHAAIRIVPGESICAFAERLIDMGRTLLEVTRNDIKGKA